MVLQAVLQHVPQLEDEERHGPGEVRGRRMSAVAAAPEEDWEPWLRTADGEVDGITSISSKRGLKYCVVFRVL